METVDLLRALHQRGVSVHYLDISDCGLYSPSLGIVINPSCPEPLEEVLWHEATHVAQHLGGDFTSFTGAVPETVKVGYPREQWESERQAFLAEESPQLRAEVFKIISSPAPAPMVQATPAPSLGGLETLLSAVAITPMVMVVIGIIYVLCTAERK